MLTQYVVIKFPSAKKKKDFSKIIKPIYDNAKNIGIQITIIDKGE